MGEQPHPEFSRRIRVDQLTNSKEFSIEATQEECLHLTKRMQVSSIDFLRARVVVAPWKGRIAGVPATGVKVTGRLESRVVQPCSVTLDPVSENIDECLSYKFINRLEKILEQKHENELVLDFEDDDPPESLVAGEIDLGELASETLALAINPYPRREGVEFVDPESVQGLDPDISPQSERLAVNPEKHPFSALSNLKSRSD